MDATSGVRLRKLHVSDAETLARWMGSSRLPETLPGLDHEYFREPENWRNISQSKQAEHFFVIALAETDRPIGISVLYAIDRTGGTGFGGTAIFEKSELNKGRGFAAKLLQLSYAFEKLRLNKVYSKVASTNERVTSGLKHLGYHELSADEKRRVATKVEHHSIHELSRESWENFTSTHGTIR